MSFRIGQCSSCGASYKLPASFEADQARCKNCGGVVQIGKAGEPAPSAAAPPVPAKKPASAAAPKPKRSGPSMKDRLIAERKAAEVAAKKSGAPKKAPATAAKPAAKPAAKRAASPAKSAATPKTGAAKRSAGGSRRSARGKSDGGSDSGSSRSGRRRAVPEKKKSPMGLIIGVVALLAIGGGGFFFMNQDSGADPDEVNAAGDGSEAVAGNSTDSGEPVLEDETSGEQDSSDEGASQEPDVAAAEPTEEEQAAAAAAAEAAASAKAAKDAAANDPASVDLGAIDDFEPFSGTSPDRLLQLEEWTATMMDPMAGAAGNRAKKKLVDAGRESMPIIINAMKRLDLTDDDDFRSADVSQKALQEICNGNNLGWKYPSSEPDRYHLFDKKVIKAWATQWSLAEHDDAYWAKLAKLDSIEAAASEEPEEDAVDDALDALDDF